MHLNDEQLLTHDEASLKHVSECEICQQKVANMHKFREKLVDLPPPSTMPDRWAEIQKGFIDKQQHKQLQSTRGQLKRWQFGSFALAASLCVVLLWSGSPKSPSVERSENMQLQAVIEQNKILQNQLDLKSQNNMLTHASYKRLQINMNSIDQAIQRAYLDNADNNEKFYLWKARQELIRKILLEDTKKQTFQI